LSDKYLSPCAPPTPYERELLDILIEECAEVTQRATKLLRFGRDEVQPGQPLSNMERLSLEIGDVREMIGRLHDAQLLAMPTVIEGMRRKRLQLAKFMQTTPDTIEPHEAMRRLSASEYACYRWPLDSIEHRALRAAYMDGATDNALAEAGVRGEAASGRERTPVEKID
jgi:hypothetical protein